MLYYLQSVTDSDSHPLQAHRNGVKNSEIRLLIRKS